MEYLAEHSSEFFSQDDVNVTLIFMRGVHNYTKDLTVHNLHSFVMNGAAESRENVIIDYQIGKHKLMHSYSVLQYQLCEYYNPDNEMFCNDILA